MNTEELVALVDRARALDPTSQPPADLLPRARTAARRHRLNVVALGVLAGAVVVVPAAVVVVQALDEGQPTPVASTPTVVDATPRCPDTLPITVDPGGHGFGPSEVADQLPSLPVPQSAWVCVYAPTDSGTTSSGGMVLSWVRNGGPVPVAAGRLSAIATALAELAVYDDGHTCTADLGARWLLSYPGDEGLIGVVVDDYGCDDVRLTDDPFATTAGAADGHGTVPGALAAPRELLNEIKAAFGEPPSVG